MLYLYFVFIFLPKYPNTQQVLYFIPQIRHVALQSLHIYSELSLLDELGLLFRMMATAGAVVVNASNLLRTLRFMREAFVLGLLEDIGNGKLL